MLLCRMCSSIHQVCCGRLLAVRGCGGHMAIGAGKGLCKFLRGIHEDRINHSKTADI